MDRFLGALCVRSVHGQEGKVGARGHLDRLPALLRSKWVRETNYPGLGKIAQVSLWIHATCSFGGYF